jgi:hypothetical protein
MAAAAKMTCPAVIVRVDLAEGRFALVNLTVMS